MKLNRITALLLTVIGSQLLAQPVLADQIIQRPYGAFYIVSDLEASKVFDRNNFGFFALSPSVIPPSHKSTGKNVEKNKPVKAAEQCPTVNCPVVPVTPVRPVATIEPAESIFLRLEQKK